MTAELFGSWVLHSVVPGTIVLAGAWAIDRRFRLAPQNPWILSAYFAGLVRMLLPPTVSFGFAIPLPIDAWAGASLESPSQVGGAPLAVNDATSSQPALLSLAATLAGVHLAVASALALRVLVGARLATQRLLAGTVPARPAVVATVRRAAHRLRTRTVPVLESSAITLPVVVGALRPRILWPTSSEEPASLQSRELRAAAALHEVAHIRRRDGIRGLALELVAAALWWNPLVRIAKQRIVAAFEFAADDLAARKSGVKRYRRSLLAIAALRYDLPVPPSALASFGFGGSSIRDRLSALDRIDRPAIVDVGKRAVSVAIVLFAHVSLTAASPGAVDSEQTSSIVPAEGSSDAAFVERFPQLAIELPDNPSCLELQIATRMHFAANQSSAATPAARPTLRRNP